MQNQEDLRTHIAIRPARRQDTDVLYALDQLCFRPGIAYSCSELRYFLAHPGSISFVAEDDTGRLAGFAIVERHLRNRAQIGHIISIDVDPGLRRQHVGQLLMEKMEQELRSAGAVSMLLEVAVDNVAAQQFYLRLGYRQTGRIPAYYAGALDALMMEKDLTETATLSVE